MKLAKKLSLVMVLILAFVGIRLGAGYYLQQGINAKKGEDKIKYFSHAVILGNDEARILRAMTYIGMRSYDKALPDLDKIIKYQPAYPVTYIYRANAYHGLKQYENALKDYGNAANLLPPYLDNIIKKKKSRLGAVAAEYGISEKDVENGLYAKLYFDRARTLREMRRYADALTDALKAAGKNPLNPESYVLAGDICTDIKVYKQALGYYALALQLSASHIPAYMGRGKAYMALGEYKKAEKEFASAFVYGEKSAGLFRLTGDVHYALKQCDKALEDYTRAKEIDPSSSEAGAGENKSRACLRRH